MSETLDQLGSLEWTSRIDSMTCEEHDGIRGFVWSVELQDEPLTPRGRHIEINSEAHIALTHPARPDHIDQIAQIRLTSIESGSIQFQFSMPVNIDLIPIAIGRFDKLECLRYQYDSFWTGSFGAPNEQKGVITRAVEIWRRSPVRVMSFANGRVWRSTDTYPPAVFKFLSLNNRFEQPPAQDTVAATSVAAAVLEAHFPRSPSVLPSGTIDLHSFEECWRRVDTGAVLGTD